MSHLNPLEVCIDRVLPSSHLARHVELSLAANPANLPTGLRRDALNPLYMAFLIGNKWQVGSTLRVRFLDGDPVVQGRVADVAREWMNYGDINLSFVKTGDAEIRISFVDHGSWSYVGTQSLSVPISSPTMNYGWLTPSTSDEEYHRVVLHEFGHALGCIHEHESPAGDMQWDKEKIYAYFGGSPNFWSKEDVDRNIFDRYSKEETNFTQLDPTSIMMYRFPKEFFLDGFSTPNNTRLSALDQQFMGENYPRGTAPTVACAVVAALQKVDLDRLSPVEAVQLVDRLKRLVGAPAAQVIGSRAHHTNGTTTDRSTRV